MIIKGAVVEYNDAVAPHRHGRDRRCSMGADRCMTAKQPGTRGEVGKIRETKTAKGTAEDWGEIHLCSLCEEEWAKSLQTIYEFTGIRKRGKGGAYELPELADIRNARGLSQYKLAKESGINRMYIQKVELGTFKASTGAAEKLAEALGVEVGELRGDS